MAGLLHDVGKLILLMNFPERYREAQEMAQSRKISLGDAEKEIFGITHAKVGAYLTGLWGLPDPIVEGLAFHHNPAQCPAREFSPLLAAYLANILEQGEDKTDLQGIGRQINREYLAGLNLLSRLPVWVEVCRQIIQGGKTDD